MIKPGWYVDYLKPNSELRVLERYEPFHSITRSHAWQRAHHAAGNAASLAPEELLDQQKLSRQFA